MMPSDLNIFSCAYLPYLVKLNSVKCLLMSFAHYLCFFMHGWAKVGLQLWVCETEFILVLLLIDYCIIYLDYYCKPTLPTPEYTCIHTHTYLHIITFKNDLCLLDVKSFVSYVVCKCFLLIGSLFFHPFHSLSSEKF